MAAQLMMASAPDPSHSGPFAILRCSVCHRTAEAARDDILAFVKTGWPQCCGEFMSILPSTGRSPDDGR
jgi:hypothetical protein